MGTFSFLWNYCYPNELARRLIRGINLCGGMVLFLSGGGGGRLVGEVSGGEIREV